MLYRHCCDVELGVAALFLLFFSIIMVKNCLSVNNLNFWCVWCVPVRERERVTWCFTLLRPVNHCGYIREREREREEGSGVDEQKQEENFQYLKDMVWLTNFIYLSVGTNIYILPQEHAHTQTTFFLQEKTNTPFHTSTVCWHQNPYTHTHPHPHPPTLTPTHTHIHPHSHTHTLTYTNHNVS